MLSKIIELIMCHAIGDYVLQSRFIAETKGSNWYHLFIHCVLYCLPFAVVFGIDWKLAIVFATHMYIDPLKARWGIIGYPLDQIMHYIAMCIIYLF